MALATKRSKLHAFVLLSLGWMLAGGCSTQINPDALTKVSVALQDVRQQSQAAFHAVNDVSRESALTFAVKQPGLKEELFAGGLPPAAVAEWDENLARLERYLQTIQILISPDRGKEFEEAAVKFGEQLKSTTAAVSSLSPEPEAPAAAGNSNRDAEISAGVATAFAKVGSLLIQAKAQRDALEVMRTVDPAIRDALVAMSHSIGDTPRSGIRGTMYSDWRTRSNFLQEPFKTAPDEEHKRAVTIQFRDLLDERDARDAMLVSLRTSLLLLADAHSAAARGQRADVAIVVARISDELTQTRALYDRFLQITKKPGATDTGTKENR